MTHVACHFHSFKGEWITRVERVLPAPDRKIARRSTLWSQRLQGMPADPHPLEVIQALREALDAWEDAVRLASGTEPRRPLGGHGGTPPAQP